MLPYLDATRVLGTPSSGSSLTDVELSRMQRYLANRIMPGVANVRSNKFSIFSRSYVTQFPNALPKCSKETYRSARVLRTVGSVHVASPTGLLGKRFFATEPAGGPLPSTPSPKTEGSEKETWMTRSLAFAKSKPGMIAIGGTAFAIVIGRIVYDITSAFIHLDLYTVAEVGFLAGLATGASGFGFITYFNRIRNIDVERVVTDALDLVQRSPKVAELMGLTGFTFSTVQQGTIRTYQIEGGHFATSRASGFPIWKKPKVQVMFQVWGGSNEKQGIVVAEAYTDYDSKRKFTFVSFDLLQGKSGFQGENPTIIVEGDESLMRVRNDMRSFVTLHRVYVRNLD